MIEGLVLITKEIGERGLEWDCGSLFLISNRSTVHFFQGFWPFLLLPILLVRTYRSEHSIASDFYIENNTFMNNASQ